MATASLSRVVGAVIVAGWSAAFVMAGVSPAQDAGAELTFERAMAATPDDMLRLTPGLVAEIDGALDDARRLNTGSRRGGTDAGGLPCVTDAIMELETLQGSAHQAQGNLEGAIARGDAAMAGFEFRKIVIARDGASVTLYAAKECASGFVFEKGSERRDVSGSGAASSGDLDGVADDIMDFAFDPNNGSPF